MRIVKLFFLLLFISFAKCKLELKSIPEHQVRIGQAVQIFAKGEFFRITNIQFKNEFDQITIAFPVQYFTSSPIIFIPVMSYVIGNEFISSRCLRICLTVDGKTKCLCLGIISQSACSLYADKSMFFTSDSSMILYGQSVVIDEVRILDVKLQSVKRIALEKKITCGKERQVVANVDMNNWQSGIYQLQGFLTGKSIEGLDSFYFYLQSPLRIKVQVTPEECELDAKVFVFASVEALNNDKLAQNSESLNRSNFASKNQRKAANDKNFNILVDQIAFFCPITKLTSMANAKASIYMMKAYIGTFNLEKSFSQSKHLHVFFLSKGVVLNGHGKLKIASKLQSNSKIRIKAYPTIAKYGDIVSIYAENNSREMCLINGVQIGDERIALERKEITQTRSLIAKVQVNEFFIGKRKIRISLLFNQSPISNKGTYFYVRQTKNDKKRDFLLKQNENSKFPQDLEKLSSEASSIGDEIIVEMLESKKKSNFPDSKTLIFSQPSENNEEDGPKLSYSNDRSSQFSCNFQSSNSLLSFSAKENPHDIVEIFAASNDKNCFLVDEIRISSLTKPEIHQTIIPKKPIEVGTLPTFIADCRLVSELAKEKNLKIEALFEGKVLDDPTAIEHKRSSMLDNFKLPVLRASSDQFFVGDIVRFNLHKEQETECSKKAYFMKDLQLSYTRDSKHFVVFNVDFLQCDAEFGYLWKIPELEKGILLLEFSFGVVFLDDPAVCHLAKSKLNITINPKYSCFLTDNSSFTQVTKITNQDTESGCILTGKSTISFTKSMKSSQFSAKNLLNGLLMSVTDKLKVLDKISSRKNAQQEESPKGILWSKTEKISAMNTHRNRRPINENEQNEIFKPIDLLEKTQMKTISLEKGKELKDDLPIVVENNGTKHENKSTQTTHCNLIGIGSKSISSDELVNFSQTENDCNSHTKSAVSNTQISYYSYDYNCSIDDDNSSDSNYIPNHLHKSTKGTQFIDTQLSNNSMEIKSSSSDKFTSSGILNNREELVKDKSNYLKGNKENSHVNNLHFEDSRDRKSKEKFTNNNSSSKNNEDLFPCSDVPIVDGSNARDKYFTADENLTKTASDSGNRSNFNSKATDSYPNNSELKSNDSRGLNERRDKKSIGIMTDDLQSGYREGENSQSNPGFIENDSDDCLTDGDSNKKRNSSLKYKHDGLVHMQMNNGKRRAKEYCMNLVVYLVLTHFIFI